MTDPESARVVIRRSPRLRRLRIAMGRDGEIVLSGPVWLSDDRYMRCYREYKQRFLKSVERRMRDSRKRVCEDAAGMLWYLGKQYPVTGTSSAPSFNGAEFLITSGLTPKERSSVIGNLYRRLAGVYISGRAGVLSGRTGIGYREIEIGSARSRLGTCTAEGRLRFTWRLMQFPAECVDFVIFHELAHRRHMGHQRDFYEFLSSICPEHLELHRELREFSRSHPTLL